MNLGYCGLRVANQNIRSTKLFEDLLMCDNPNLRHIRTYLCVC